MKTWNKMKAIKYIILLGIVHLFNSCSNDDHNYQDQQNIQPFIRFNFITNSNNVPLEYPQVSTTTIPRNSFTNNAVKPLKIPVALTYAGLKSEVTATYTMQTELDGTAFAVSPETLSFSPQKLTDTIIVNFTERWDSDAKIDFTLNSVSDQEVHIGNLNDNAKNDTFEITLGDLSTSMSFENNRLEISGTTEEASYFQVNFPNGYFDTEIDDNEIFSFLNDFSYDISRASVTSTSILYKITLNEPIDNDDLTYQSVISLVENEQYSLGAISRLQIIKPIKTDRDPSINPAAKFYDPTNPYFRTYGENWIDHDNDGECTWRNYFAFTQPIEVSADHPNAVLYSDNGTPDTSDDIYYDAFRISFKSTLAGRTTNPFNLQRWFSNEATDADRSPGFNIDPALEFYPENGNDPDKGSVLVVSQFITISNKDGKSFEFAISGSGTYFRNDQDIVEIDLTLNVTNQEVYGGTVSSRYRIYNSNGYTDPEPLTDEACINEVTLE
ncbi:hypothetical protein [Robertkochia solimangrovi]|uniref:hypothetical protein n=1 Tax=Robertkochia solimangrovi TaxID=2213046 RepID=UPI00117FDEF8|nr:hypothetical protein [Robertkochia solimangrovi]TRZ43198.1 hypothetical protein DMZ48_10930 [Robertkochia solimangrovi]